MNDRRAPAARSLSGGNRLCRERPKNLLERARGHYRMAGTLRGPASLSLKRSSDRRVAPGPKGHAQNPGNRLKPAFMALEYW